MQLTHTPLKPLDLSESRKPARSHLLPSDFSSLLTHGKHRSQTASPLIHPDRPNTPHDEQLVEQARKWVSQTFFGTLLKQMRNSPFKSPLFEGGRGGQAFGELYDQHLVDHMSRGVGNKLVGAMVRRIVKKEEASAAYARQSTVAHTAGSSTSGGSGHLPDHHAGDDSGERGGAASFAQKRRAAPPNIYSIRK